MEKELNIPNRGEVMPSFFSYNQTTSSVIFTVNGVSFDCKSRAQFKNLTFARIVSGLNHFLAYFFENDQDKLRKINMLIVKELSSVHNIYIDFYKNKKLVESKDIITSLKEHTIVPQELCYYISEYVDNVSDLTIDESAATTDITLSNEDAKVLAILSIVIKLNYIFSGLLRGDMTYDKTVSYTADKLIFNTITSYKRYMSDKYGEEFDISNNVDQHSLIDNFIYNIIDKIFQEKAKTNYKQKFSEFGKDAIKLGLQRRITILASLRSYIPKLKDEETTKKYCLNPDDEEEIKVLMRDLMFVNTSIHDYKDFTYNSLNMASYINKSLLSIIQKQDLTQDFPDVNRSEFLYDSSDSDMIKKESSYFEDKNKHLFNLRRDTMEFIISDFVDELKKINDKDFINTLKYFIIDKKHPLNTYIEYRILLCITGEAKIYYKTIGIYGKLILGLFWYKIKSNPQLNHEFGSIVDMMTRRAITGVSTIQEDELESILNSFGFNDSKYKKIKNLLCMYTDNTNSTYSINPIIMCRFIKFMDESYNVMNLLFPDRVNLDPVIINNENHYNIKMNNVDSKTYDESVKYIKNKKFIKREVM